jgi:hypothetical protein
LLTVFPSNWLDRYFGRTDQPDKFTQKRNDKRIKGSDRVASGSSDSYEEFCSQIVNLRSRIVRKLH